MTDHPFVHLHVHTEYSLLDGLSKIKKLVARAQQLEMTSLAITDHGTMFGVIDFYRACKAAGIKPIIGLEGYLARRSMHDRDPKLDSKPFHLLMLAHNQTGYRNLLKIASAAQLEGYYYRPRIDRDFLAAHSEGLIVTSGCLAAQVPSLIMAGKDDEARELLDWYLQVFGRDRFFLELQQHKIDELAVVNEWLVRIGKRDQVRLVATSDVHYVLKGDADAHDTLLCIQTGATKSEADRLKMSDDSYYLVEGEGMWRDFGHINDGEPLLNTLAIAEMCDIDLDKKGYHLPTFPVPEGFDAETYLRHLCQIGLRWRYGDAPEGRLVERLDYELGVIHNMGFDTYFLIVWDLCAFARFADIWWNVRGSGAGSMTAYCLGITNIDPIQNNLLFERFLNPGRVSMPDIDIDFPDDRRAEMIDYTARKYGEDKVAAIITFGTLGAKAAVRDVGRALGVSLDLVNNAARMIPTEPKPKKVMEYVEDNPDLKKLYETNPDIRRIVEVAGELQGVSRHASTHAAGIIVSDLPLVEYIPLHRQTKGEDTDSALRQVTQFPMETCESIGLLKVDFLGLSTLTILRRACDLIARHRGEYYDMSNIPYRPSGDHEKDARLAEAFEMLGRGETVGVFQVESSGMQQMLRGMRPTKFEHIVAGISLYRPGPMDFIPQYNNRMHGLEPVLYHHPNLESILAETYGIMVYQEQIMQIAGSLFGYSLADADLMRRAVSKKKKEDLLKHKEIFIKRGPELDPTITPEVAEKIFDEIEFFANYGFNKAHAADYGVITVQSAYLKCHYAPEYMAALLSVYFDDAAKVTTFLSECKRLNIPILPPDVNYSMLDFDIQTQADGQRGIRFGMAAIKNAGVGALQHIIDARQQGVFRDVEDFCRRIDLRLVGKRAVESLIKVGAFAGMGTRPQLLGALDRMMTFSADYHKAQEIGQSSMFGGDSALPNDDLLSNLPHVDEVSQRDMLNWEKELLGLYVSSHPIDPVMNIIQHIDPDYTHELKDTETRTQDEPVKVVALVAGLRKVATKNKDIMAIVQLEDRYGTIDAVLFPRTWRQYEEMVVEGTVLLFAGKLDLSRGDPQIICEHVTSSFDAVISDNHSAHDDYLPVWYTDDAPPMPEPPPFDPDPPPPPVSAHATTNGSPSPATITAPPDAGDGWQVWHDTSDLSPDQFAGFGVEETVVVQRSQIVVYFNRSGEPDKDKRRLKSIYNTFLNFPGDDSFVVVLRGEGDEYQLVFPNDTTGYSPELHAKLEKLVGEGCVEVIPL